MTAIKLALTSDLYLPVTAEAKLIELAREMRASEPDVVILAGDLAESLSDFSRVVTLFRKEFTCPIGILPGDVDFWARPPYDSHRLWAELLPQTVRNQGCFWLEGKALVVGDVAIAGTVGWYDYSAAGMAGIVTDMEFAQQKYLYNADALRIDWEWADPEFAGQVGSVLLTTLDHLQQDPAIQRIVVVTHFPILDQQLNRKPGTSFATAYSGNLTLGRNVLTRSKVSHIISGHTHHRRQGEVHRLALSPVEFHVLPGDYEKPGWLCLTLKGDSSGL